MKMIAYMLGFYKNSNGRHNKPKTPSSVAERLRRRLCNQKIAGSNPASGHLATPFRKEI